jgi:uncharacterized protein with beta-barrel porin domain
MLGAGGRLGIALGYGQQRLSDAAGGEGRTDSLRASLYASQPIGPVGLSAVASYAHGWIDTDRETGIGQAHTKRRTSEWLGGVQAAVPYRLAGATITPAAGIVVARLRSDAFAETGIVPDTFLVTGRAAARTFVTPFAQIGWSYAITQADGLQIIPDAQIGYRYSRAASGAPITLAASDGTLFDGNRIGLSRTSLNAGASLTLHKGRWTGFATWRGQFGSTWEDNGGTVGVRLAF